MLLAFPSSNQNVRADLQALENARMLALFCTTIAWGQGRHLVGILTPAMRRELARRAFDDIPPARIRTFPAREVVRLIATRLGLSSLLRHETGWASYDSVSQDFDRRVAHEIRRGKVRASAVYAYEYAALRIFEAAAERGMRRFYELPIGYWRAGLRIMEEERERNPEWAPTIDLLRDSREKQARKDDEIANADHIIVPSEFVRATLREHPALTATVDVIPYGAPTTRPSALASRSRAPKLRLLYVGHLSQRKGVSYLFEAMRQLRGIATLTLVGPKVGEACPILDLELRVYRWLGSLPHPSVLDLMARHDLLVFPSLFEGFGLVILEAMAQGVPVITTTNTGGPLVIDHGRDGFIVPIRDAASIVEHVSALHRERDHLAAMSEAALKKAEALSWTVRERVLIKTICDRMARGELAADAGEAARLVDNV